MTMDGGARLATGSTELRSVEDDYEQPVFVPQSRHV